MRHAIFEAVEAGDVDAVRSHLADDPTCATAVDHVNAGPLHFACYVQNVEMVAALLEAGADPRLVDSEFGVDAAGWLDQGVFDGHDDPAPVARLLVAAGQVIGASRAVVFDLPDVLSELLEADRSLISEHPLLHDAIYLNRRECVAVLLAAGADADATFPDLDDEDYHLPASSLAAALGRTHLLGN